MTKATAMLILIPHVRIEIKNERIELTMPEAIKLRDDLDTAINSWDEEE